MNLDKNCDEAEFGKPKAWPGSLGPIIVNWLCTANE